jgi:hypothetical protein
VRRPSRRGPLRDEAVYRVAPGHWCRFDSSSELFLSALGGVPVVVEADLAALVRRRRQFQPLLRHAIAAFAETLLMGRGIGGLRAAFEVMLSTVHALLRSKAAAHGVGALLSRFEVLAERGVLVSESDALRHWAPPRAPDPAAGPAAAIDTLAVLTAGRPVLVSRCLESFEAQARIPARCLVVDDSTGDHVQQARSSAAAAGGMRLATRIGSRERCDTILELARTTGVALETIELGLGGDRRLGFSAGASRNLVLLLTAGTRVFMVDDDTLCRPGVASGPSTETSPAWAIDSSFHCRTVHAFADREAAIASAHPIRLDPLDAHARVLGSGLRSWLHSSKRDGRALARADDRALLDLWREDPTIVFSMNGVVGHSGAQWPLQVFSVVPEADGRPLRSEDIFTARLETQSIAAQVPTSTLSNVAYCSTMFVGLDNRRMLPPFLPYCRGEDVLFGRLLRLCRPPAYSADLPFTLVHDPPPREPPRLEQLAAQTGVELSYLLGDVLESFGRTAVADPVRELERLAECLRALSEPTSLAEAFRLAYVRRTASRIAAVETALSAASARRAPECWRRASAAHLRRLRGALGETASWLPLEFRDGGGREHGFELARRAVTGFADLLDAWPALWNAARAVRQHHRSA